MKRICQGEGQASFPIFFLFSFLLIWALGSALFLSESAGQKPERESLSRFDRLAEEATLLNKRGKYEEVISLLEPHKADKKNDSTLFFNELGIAYRNKGKWNEAIQVYQQAYVLEPQNPEVSPVILNNLGYTLFLKKDYPRAIEQYEKAIALAPRFKEAHSNLSQTYYEQQKYEDALKEIEVVLKLDPNHEAAKKFRERIRKKMQEKK
jgi:tetratricopeptide (TPR) repeat protein